MRRKIRKRLSVSVVKMRKSSGKSSMNDARAFVEAPSDALISQISGRENHSGYEAEIRQDTSHQKANKKIADIDLVDEQELRGALAKILPKHAKEQLILLGTYKACYEKWLFQIRCGYGLLMYGFGSKRALIEDFASSTFVDGAVVVVNGYLPAINIKQVVYAIVDALWKQQPIAGKSVAKLERDNESQPVASQSLEELVGFITDFKGNCFTYVVVHNIDGPGLRSEETQHLFVKLAASKRVRFVASIDHVNAPLLWDKQMMHIFNWWWHHTPTFAPYEIEVTFLPFLLTTTGVKGVHSAALVLRSLTPNAQSVFRTLASHQLSHQEDFGLTQHQLYTLCREQFLVSNELTLRAHLTEFKDHQLICSRRGLDGQDCLYIPLQSRVLIKLLEDLDI